MPVAKKKDTAITIDVPALKQGIATIRILGNTPLFQNRMSKKVREGLLVGMRKKTAADKLHIKHNPMEEYRSSMEIMPSGPTLCGVRAGGIKRAMADAAIDTPGLQRTVVQRNIFVPDELVPLYGVPQLRMDVVRSADINRTPDIRTRAFFPEWAVEFSVRFVEPMLNSYGIAQLTANAGMLIGIGDGRQQKGACSFGAFRTVQSDEDEAMFEALVANAARPAQELAFENPEWANDETSELMEFYNEELQRRAA